MLLSGSSHRKAGVRDGLPCLVERPSTAEKLVAELEMVFTAADGPPKVLRMDNGPEMISQALQQFCADRVGIVYIPPGTPWNDGYIESFNRRLRRECLNRNHWTSLLEARVVIGDFKTEHNLRHRRSALGYMTPAEYAAACIHTHHPRGVRDQLILDQKQPGLKDRVVPSSGTGHVHPARRGVVLSEVGQSGRPTLDKAIG